MLYERQVLKESFLPSRTGHKKRKKIGINGESWGALGARALPLVSSHNRCAPFLKWLAQYFYDQHLVVKISERNKISK